VEVGSEEEFTDLVSRSPLPVLVDFWAPWCGPCRMVSPEVAKIARDEAGRVVVAKVDTDVLPQVAGRLGIKGVPTMVLYRQGREQQRISGAGSAASLTAQLGL
jgi:thioredoxin